MKLKSIAMAAFMLMPFAGQVLARDVVTWGLVNFDPKNTSRTDLAREFISEKLNGYSHETVVAPIPRIVSEIRAGSHWCWAGAIKTEERMMFSSLSMPFIFTFPQRVIIRKSRYKEFMSRGPLSLEALLQDKDRRTSIARSRAYSPGIDALLARYPPPQSTSSIAEAVQMLMADRLDYILEDAGVAKAHAQSLGNNEGLIALPFKEMTDYVLGRIMCPRNDWGKKVVLDINAVLSAERGSARYRSIVETYHDEDERRAIRQVYDEVFLKSE